MARAPAPSLTSIVPRAAVPERLRSAVAKVLGEWGYGWEELALSGTAELGSDRQIWVFAVSSAPLSIGDELQSAGGRAAGVGVSAYSGGVIPVTPYQAHVYEFLGRRGGGQSPEAPTPTAPPATQSTDSRLAKLHEGSSRR